MMLAFDAISAFPFQIVILFFVTIDFTKFWQILEHYYFISTIYLPHGCGLLTMSRSNSTLVICSWIDSWFASANKYNKVHEKYWVWLFGYLSWLAIQFKNKYLPSVSKSTARFWNISICEEWAKSKKKMQNI